MLDARYFYLWFWSAFLHEIAGVASIALFGPARRSPIPAPPWARRRGMA